MFDRKKLAPIQTDGETSVWAYKTEDDSSIAVRAIGYFNDAADVLEVGSAIISTTKYGVLTLYISAIEDGVLYTQSSTTPTLEGEIAGLNTITVAEINTILAAYEISTPLSQSIQIIFHDPTQQPDSAFFTTYDANIDQWYFEKLTPCPV